MDCHSASFKRDPGVKEDWASEFATMEKVYGNAYCNIATTSTTSPSTSLLLSTPSEVSELATVSVNFSGKNDIEHKGNFTVIDSNI